MNKRGGNRLAACLALWVAVGILALPALAGNIASLTFLGERYSLEEKGGDDRLWRNEYTVDARDPVFQRRLRVWNFSGKGITPREVGEYILKQSGPQGSYSLFPLGDDEVMVTFFGGEGGDRRGAYVMPPYNAWRVLKQGECVLAVGFVVGAYMPRGNQAEQMRRGVIFSRMVQADQRAWQEDLRKLPLPEVYH